MKTNHILSILMSLLLAAGFISCSDDNGLQPDPIHFVLENDLLSFQKESASNSFRIKSAVTPQIECSADWVSLKLESLTASIHRLDVTVSENTGNDRTATVKIISGTETKTLTINQSSEPRATVTDITDWLGLGWNPGNQMDSYKNGVADELSDGNPPITQELFDKVKAAGFKTIRLPVTWIGHIGPAPDYKIDDRLERVAEIVGYAEKAGLNIIVNIHHDGSGGYGFWLDFKPAVANVAKNLEVEDQFRKVWTQIAERFVDTGHFLIFEAFNEIHDGDWGWGANLTDNGRQYELLNEWLQIFVDAVRSTGGQNATRYLGIPGYAGGWEWLEHLKLPKDSAVGRLLVSAHLPANSAWNSTTKVATGHISRSGGTPLPKVSIPPMMWMNMDWPKYSRASKNGLPTRTFRYISVNSPAQTVRPAAKPNSATIILNISARQLMTAACLLYSGIMAARVSVPVKVLYLTVRQARLFRTTPRLSP